MLAVARRWTNFIKKCVYKLKATYIPKKWYLQQLKINT